MDNRNSASQQAWRLLLSQIQLLTGWSVAPPTNIQRKKKITFIEKIKSNKMTDQEVLTQMKNLHIISNSERVLLSSHCWHFCPTQAPPPLAALADLPHPCPIFFNYRGSPSWRVILHVQRAWAGIGGNRCHPRRLDARLFVPEQVWEWERARGVRLTWRARCTIPTIWLEGSDVKTSLAPHYARAIFLPDGLGRADLMNENSGSW